MQKVKHYYYMKLKDRFFDEGAVRILEGDENGYFKVLLYLRLCLLSLPHEGRLLIKENHPYQVGTLSRVLGFPEKEVEEGISSLLDMGFLEMTGDGSYYVTDIELFTGKSSDEGDRKRMVRMKLAAERKGSEESDIPPASSDKQTDKCPHISEKEKKKEKESEPEKEQEPKKEPARKTALRRPPVPEGKITLPPQPQRLRGQHYGLHKNVFITDDEYRELQKAEPCLLSFYIDYLSENLFKNPQTLNNKEELLRLIKTGRGDA